MNFFMGGMMLILAWTIGVLAWLCPFWFFKAPSW